MGIPCEEKAFDPLLPNQPTNQAKDDAAAAAHSVLTSGGRTTKGHKAFM